MPTVRFTGLPRKLRRSRAGTHFKEYAIPLLLESVPGLGVQPGMTRVQFVDDDAEHDPMFATVEVPDLFDRPEERTPEVRADTAQRLYDATVAFCEGQGCKVGLVRVFLGALDRSQGYADSPRIEPPPA